jgi:acetyltransferase-like isoleucine patch superfamily enzyme
MDRFKEWKKPIIEEGKLTKWNWMVQGVKGLILGKKTDIGAFTYINSSYGVELADNVQIGSHCSIYSISTIDGKTGKVTIGENSCIGAHSVIMPGVTIGENCIVGALSFVNKSIPDNCLAFGTPCRVQWRTDNIKVNNEEYEYNKSIDRLCSKCNKYADVVIPNKIKLCSKCYRELEALK